MTRRPAILLVIACLVTAALGWSTGRSIDALPWSTATGAATPAAPVSLPASTSPAASAAQPFTPRSQIEAILARPLLVEESLTPTTSTEAPPIPAIPTTGQLDFAHLSRIGERSTRHHCQADYQILPAADPADADADANADAGYRFTRISIDGRPLPAAASVTWRAGQQDWQQVTVDPAVEHFITTLARRLGALRQGLQAPDDQHIQVATADARLLVPVNQVADGRYQSTSIHSDEIRYQPQPAPAWDWRFFQRDEQVLRATRLSLTSPERVSTGGMQ